MVCFEHVRTMVGPGSKDMHKLFKDESLCYHISKWDDTQLKYKQYVPCTFAFFERAFLLHSFIV